MYFTLKETIDNHRKLWDWLAEEQYENHNAPFRLKQDWPEWDKIIDPADWHDEEDPVINHCFLCQWVDQQGGLDPNDSDCEKVCPLKWPGVWGCHTCCGDSLYSKWYNSHNKKERGRIAAQIRDLPIGEKIKEEYENGK
jgi:hypothetical protein